MLVKTARLAGPTAIAAVVVLGSCTPGLFDIITNDVLPKFGALSLTTGTLELPTGTGLYEFSRTVQADGAGGDALTGTITLTNTGDAPLTVSQPSLTEGDTAHFSLDTSAYVATIGEAGSGESRTSFNVVFDPLAVGGLAATVTITSNDPDTPTYTIEVSGDAAWWGVQSVKSVGDPTTHWDWGDLYVDGLNVYIVYADLAEVEVGTYVGDLRILGSQDGGLTWSLDKAIIPYNDISKWGVKYAAVHAAGDVIPITYQYYNTSPLGELWFTRSDDGGATWPLDVQVDNTGFDVGTFPSIAVNGAVVYITHFDNYNTNYDLRFARSVNGGATWPVNNTIDTTDRPGEFNSLVNTGNTLYVAYWESNSGLLRFARSGDAGDNWNLQTVDGPDYGSHADIATDGTNVFISHFDWTKYELRFARSLDDGVTWNPADLKVIDADGGPGYWSSIQSSGSDVYVAYTHWDTVDGRFEDLEFARSTDLGATWPAENFRMVDTGGQVGMYADMELDEDGNIYILYYDGTNGQITLAKSVDGGDTW